MGVATIENDLRKELTSLQRLATLIQNISTGGNASMGGNASTGGNVSTG